MIINHNIPAINSYRSLKKVNDSVDSSLEKLSSGLRINKAGDDSAGLAISEKMRAQINGLEMASRNAQDAISLIQTAEGALNEVHSILQSVRELAVQSSNDTNTTSDRSQIQLEVNELLSEIDRIGETTQFNGKTLLSGSYQGTALSFQVGANEGQSVSLLISTIVRASNLGATTKLSQISVTTGSGANTAITSVDTAITEISGQRSRFGAYQNRLEYAVNNLENTYENLSAAESRIRDVDMAKEMTNYSKNSIISQASTSMLAQANIRPQMILQLMQ